VPILAEIVDAVVGVDTHRDTHQVEIATPTGATLGTIQIPNTTNGFAELVRWIGELTPGPHVVVAIEGTRSYGIGLARALETTGWTVIESEQPARRARRGRGKSDPIDAHLSVLFALNQDAARLPTPRIDGNREALRILLGARHELTLTATAQTNRLRALLLGGDDTERHLSRHTLSDDVLVRLGRRRTITEATPVQTIRTQEIRRLALALRDAAQTLKVNRQQLLELVEATAPGLLKRPGVGPVTGAQLIVSYSHPGRVRSEAAFAALAGTSPLQASSGRTTRHRLNRGGDRALNRALHTIALTRMRSDSQTRAYVNRRTAEGKTTREIRRMLKRYITRELYRTVTAAMAT